MGLLGRCLPPRRLTDWANGKREVRLAITCDIDGAETHHNVALVDGAGKLVAKRRISDDAESYRRPLERLVEAADTAQVPIPVAIETRADCSSRACAQPRGQLHLYPVPPGVVDDRHRARCRDHVRAVDGPTAHGVNVTTCMLAHAFLAATRANLGEQHPPREGTGCWPLRR